MRNLIQRAGPFRLKLRRNRFHALVSSILSQQISGKAAASIRARLEEYVAPERISPETLGRLTPKQLRGVGVSPQKASYLLDLAERVESGGLRLHRLARMTDEEVIEALIRVKGIGVWTAHMFLIFHLERPDILATGDLGIRTAIQRGYGLEELPTPDEMERIATPWRPHRSTACRYLWRSLANDPM